MAAARLRAVASSGADAGPVVSGGCDSEGTECVVYDKDVLRMPSLQRLYRAGGMTALLAATLKSQRELAQTAQLYGDHSFLTFVLTDGQENARADTPTAPVARTTS